MRASLVILVQALFQHGAEGLPDFCIGLGVLAGGAFQLAEHAADETAANLYHLRIVLQHFARDVERQVLAVDDAAHEAQVRRQQVGIVGDVDTADIEFHPALASGVGQIERRRRRHEQQDGIGLTALDLVVQGEDRLVEGRRDRAIGLRVVFRRHLGLRALPQGAGGIDLARLALVVDQLDGKEDVIGIGPNDPLEFVCLQVAAGLRLEMKHDLGAARHPLRLLAPPASPETGAAGRRPHPGLVRPGLAARHRSGRPP